MTAKASAVQDPPIGYLTDGKRVVEVIHRQKNGDLLVLDVKSAVPGGGEAVQHFTVKAQELDGTGWATPEEWSARER